MESVAHEESSRERSRAVLIVDDDPGVAEALKTLLEDEGYTVETACNGREALLLLARSRAPCIILLDLMMPVMDGFEFHAEQQRQPALAKIPVVVLTAGSVDRRASNLRASGVLSKPIKVDALFAVLDKYC